ncbi:WD40 repeat domain-containing protein [Desulfovibrio sp. JC010]|uniref:WD40 repeat domain-containing protein n=1 Tax=Desulfovibrio sp. JC010 TaxID=2593641 RepID=UPI0013D5FEC3|nr:WD40 repeat domain-containing protein [Desulfovibrio sp. JC010]NDV27713.1 WD40 repeat domain-containing protein [Desulfovibrio sp. JC010]
MSDFRKMRWPSKGADLLLKTQAGTKLVLKNILIGAGTWTDEFQASGAPDELVDVRRKIAVTKVEQDGTKVVASGLVTNDDLENGFHVTELGVTAEHPDFGEVLYMADWVPLEKASYFHDKSGTPLEAPVSVAVTVSPNAEVGIVIEDRFYSASLLDLDDHNNDKHAHPNLFKSMAAPQPTMLAPVNGDDNVGATPLLRCLPHSTILKGPEHYATTWLLTEAADTKFATPIHDSGPLTTALTEYELPSGIVVESHQYRSACIHHVSGGLISVRAEATLWTTRAEFTYPKRPTMLLSSTTNVYEQPMLSMSAFEVVGGADTHAADQYQVKNGDGVVIWTSPELTAGEPYKLIAGLLKTGRDYTIEGRQRGTVLGWSEWAIGVEIHTAPAFVSADEAVYVGDTWLEYMQASAAGVALDTGAVLRSNPVLQDVGEGNWISHQVRVVMRLIQLWSLLPDTSNAKLVIAGNPGISAGDKLLLDSGIVNAGSVAFSDFSGFKSWALPADDKIRCVDYSAGELWIGCDKKLYRWNGTSWDPFVSSYAGSREWQGVAIHPNGSVWAVDMYRAKLHRRLPGETEFTPVYTHAGYNAGPRAVAIINSDTVGVLIYSGGVRTHDAKTGALVTEVLDGGPGVSLTQALAVGPNGELVIGGNGFPVKRSIDNGRTWQDITAAIQCKSLDYDDDGNLFISWYAHPNRYLKMIPAGSSSPSVVVDNVYVNDISFSAGGKFYVDATATTPILYGDTCATEIDITAAALDNPPDAAAPVPAIAVATGAEDAVFTADDYTAVSIESATLITDDDPVNPNAVVIDTAETVEATSFRKIAVQVEPPVGTLTAADEVVINMDKQG